MTKRPLLSLSAALFTSVLAFSAYANSTGIAGYSGKQNGASCTSCHSGGAAPTVTIVGPVSLAPGRSGDYTMVVKTTTPKAGGSIAATDGATLTAGSGLKSSGAELVQVAAINANAGEVSFTFKVTAPMTGTSLTLFGAGLSANGTGTTGDGTLQIKKEIAIGTQDTTVHTPPPPAKQPAKAPTGAGDQGDGDEAAADDETSTPKRRRDVPVDDGGCTSTGGPVDGPAALALLLALFLVRGSSSRRRAR